MDVGLPSYSGGARIDHHDSGAAVTRLLQVGHQVDARGRGIGAPDQNQLGFRVVLVGHRRHLAVEAQVGDAGRRGTHRARQPRGTKPAEQRGVSRVLGQQTVRAAVAERQNRFAARFRANRREPRGDELERLVPAGAAEAALALGANAHGGKVQPVLAVDAPIEAAHLGADVAARDRIGRAAVDGGDATALDRDLQSAGIGTVEGAGRFNGGFRRRDGGTNGHASSYRGALARPYEGGRTRTRVPPVISRRA